MKRIALALLLLSVACNRGETAKTQTTAAPSPPIGNAARGQQLATQYGCNVCHLVPGVDGPRGSLGPSLQGVASRPMISQGTVKNTPPNLVLYLQNPASLNPQSTMPPLGVSADDAKDIAAFLMTLK